jgi:hypothetical protein
MDLTLSEICGFVFSVHTLYFGHPTTVFDFMTLSLDHRFSHLYIALTTYRFFIDGQSLFQRVCRFAVTCWFQPIIYHRGGIKAFIVMRTSFGMCSNSETIWGRTHVGFPEFLC